MRRVALVRKTREPMPRFEGSRAGFGPCHQIADHGKRIRTCGVTLLLARSTVIPPIATSGFVVKRLARRSISSPTTGSGRSFVTVAKTGPKVT